jgi:predicted permease
MKFLLQDVRFSLRLLRKSPGFTIAAALTLALGIGANAVVFSAVNALILRSLKVPQAESLYGIERVSDFSARQSYPDYIDLRDRNHSFDGLAAYTLAQAGLNMGDNASRAWVVEASGNYFDVLGIQPYLGRFFHASDEHGPNTAPYIVLSYTYWHSHFQDDRSVVGRIVQVNKHPYTIIGVAQPEFHGTLLFFAPDIFLPMVNQEQVEGTSFLNERGTHWVLMAMGHLKAGVTPAQAGADIDSIWSNLQKTYPKDHAPMNFALARPSLYSDSLGRPLKAFLTALMMLAALILLAACANLGSLFAARATDRSQEVALRLALGSSRNRILRQLFVEAMLISLIGGVVGLLGSLALLRWLTTWQPVPQFPLNVPVNPDANVYLVAVLLTVVSGFMFGAVPVRQIFQTNSYEIIKAGGTGSVGRKITFRDVLLVLQITICAFLVTSSLVAVRGLARSLHSNFGFEPRGAIIVDTVLDMAGYPRDAMPAMQKRMLDAVETIPGVSVAMINWPPLSGNAKGSSVFTDETADMRPANAAATALMFKISPDYFHPARTTLMSGRTITWHDDASAPPVAVVNQEFGRKIFGSATSALGRYFKMPDGMRIQVVGIVENGKYLSLTENPQPAMFLPLLQSSSSETWMVVRSSGDQQQVASAVRSKLRDLDAGLPCFIETWDEGLNLALFPSRVATVALGLLGIMGVTLSISGIFGMAAYSVSKRMRELGIRMALGARRKQVLQVALGRAFKLLASGSLAGLLMGVLAARVLASVVYQATSRDPAVLGGVVVAMSLLGLLATWIPAQRALAVDPLRLLRDQ